MMRSVNAAGCCHARSARIAEKSMRPRSFAKYPTAGAIRVRLGADTTYLASRKAASRMLAGIGCGEIDAGARGLEVAGFRLIKIMTLAMTACCGDRLF